MAAVPEDKFPAFYFRSDYYIFCKGVFVGEIIIAPEGCPNLYRSA